MRPLILVSEAQTSTTPGPWDNYNNLLQAPMRHLSASLHYSPDLGLLFIKSPTEEEGTRAEQWLLCGSHLTPGGGQT